MEKQKVSEHFIRLGMTSEMRRQINDWRMENRNPETGEPHSFSECCRQLIGLGLRDGKQKKGDE